MNPTICEITLIFKYLTMPKNNPKIKLKIIETIDIYTVTIKPCKRKRRLIQEYA